MKNIPIFTVKGIPSRPGMQPKEHSLYQYLNLDAQSPADEVTQDEAEGGHAQA
jgi:hypothetical protein